MQMQIKELNKPPVMKEITYREHLLLSVGVIPENIIYELVSNNYDITNTVISIEKDTMVINTQVYPRKVEKVDKCL